MADALRPVDGPAQTVLRSNVLRAFGVETGDVTDERLRVNGLQSLAANASISRQQCIALAATGVLSCDSLLCHLIVCVSSGSSYGTW